MAGVWLDDGEIFSFSFWKIMLAWWTTVLFASTCYSVASTLYSHDWQRHDCCIYVWLWHETLHSCFYFGAVAAAATTTAAATLSFILLLLHSAHTYPALGECVSHFPRRSKPPFQHMYCRLCCCCRTVAELSPCQRPLHTIVSRGTTVFG